MYRSLVDLVRKSYTLVRPFGLKRLCFVFFFILAQGLFQVIGVTSIFPFLTLAANPDRMRETSIGDWFTEHFPTVTDQQLLIWTGIVVVVAVLLASVMNLVSEVVRTVYVARFSHWLRMRLLWRYLERPYGFFLQNHSGIMLKKVSADVNGFTSGVLLPLLDSCARAMTAFLLFVTLFIVSWKIALAATLGLGIYYTSVFTYLRGRRQQLSDGMKQAGRGGWISLQHLFGGIKPVMVHGVQANFAGAYERFSKRIVQLAPKMPIYTNVPRYLIEPLVFGGMVVFVLVLIAQGRSIESVLPQLGVLGLAGYRLLPAAQLLYGQVSGIEGMGHTVDEVFDEFREVESFAESRKDQTHTESAKARPLSLTTGFRIDRVSFSYVDAIRPAVRDITLSVSKGSSVAFVGPSGSGKSTLVDLIIGLHTPQTGKIWVDEAELTRQLVPSWRKTLGYVPQDIFLLDASLTENIAFGVPVNEIDLERVRSVAEQAQILDFIETQLPEKFDTRVGERGVRLSGGQRQRIGLARALYHNPEVLILDEATSALDSRTEAAFMESIETLRGKLTIVMIAHRLSTVEKCDTIFFMENGRLVDSGSYHSLVRTCPAFAQLALQSQTGNLAGHH